MEIYLRDQCLGGKFLENKALNEKEMSAAEVAKCQAKCKAEGKKCDAGSGKKC